MDWFSAHKESMDEVFGEAEHLIRTFPEPLNHHGLAYFAKFDLRQQESTKNYICYLLPYWMQEVTQLPTDVVKRLSLANVFVMLYYFVVDDIMDSTKGTHKDKLPLANLFQLQFQMMYRVLFPPQSPFWHYYETYVLEWADAVAGEPGGDYFHTDKRKVAWKASPVKNASTGALLHAGQVELIPAVTGAVEQVLVTLQMLDDWADWEEDLDEGSYNCLLAFLRGSVEGSEGVSPTPDWVKQMIYVRDGLEGYSEVAVRHHEELLALDLSMKELSQFHLHLVNHLRLAAKEIKEKRNQLLSGGLSYFMSNSSNF
ncbi:hypothetical protein HZF08_38310 [Paenibacillus sp. CGMCC 1.16610]|uniref:Class 1 isoprenoid biosynthesis enzyme n=1 Tax=Paenibacillus anseongense TaxID=2682845 RepID=A0ABW9UCY2_9BACL|nr:MULTISPECIES: hypothetical protein [Paenibacillus]MBA2944132.1 hypothetical protein [Paenibacillus sp. CGMCC 1.16610]MVQ38022.1 hypothetical protein [Paenibacillus anseongense]